MHVAPITSDPDVAAAVADFTGSVIEIRDRSRRWFYTPEGSQERADEQAAIEELTGTMTARCERIGLSIDDLFRLINADLATRRDDPGVPRCDFQRFLLDENTRAHGAEAQMERQRRQAVDRHTRELVAIDQLLGRRRAERQTADRLCAGLYAGWAIRGRTFS